MRTTSRLLHLAILTGLSGMLFGCPPKVVEPEDPNTLDPKVVFQEAVSVLQASDQGMVDHELAYNKFVQAAELGAGPKAAFNAGWTAEVLGRTADAEKYYRKAYEGDKGYQAAMFSLARVLSSTGKGEEAVSILQAYVDSNPDDREVRNDLVAALSEAGMYDQAIAEAQELLRQDPKDASVYRNLSSLYYAKGEYGMSQLCSEKAMELNEGDPGTYNNMAVTYLIQEDEPAAIEKLKTSIKLDADNFEANMNLGFVALNSGDYALALDCFNKATAAKPSSTDAKLGLAVALRGTKDYDKAAEIYDEIIKAEPDNRMAYYNASTLHEKYTKDYKRSLKYLQAWVDQNTGKFGPDDPVFDRIARVEKSETAEKERIAAEKAAEQARKEREKRQREQLEGLKTKVASAKGKIEANQTCLDPMLVEEIGMFLEQGDMIIAAEDLGMVADINEMLDTYYGPMLDEAVAACAGAAPAPEEGDDAAPEGGDEAPPAEGGAEEAPPAEGGAE